MPDPNISDAEIQAFAAKLAGKGISDEERKKLREAFARAMTTTQPRVMVVQAMPAASPVMRAAPVQQQTPAQRYADYRTPSNPLRPVNDAAEDAVNAAGEASYAVPEAYGRAVPAAYDEASRRLGDAASSLQGVSPGALSMMRPGAAPAPAPVPESTVTAVPMVERFSTVPRR